MVATLPDAGAILESWGRLSRQAHTLVPLHRASDVARALRNHQPGIAYGAGRSYGDAPLNPGGVAWTTQGLDRFVDFDEERGLLVCEAGMLLRDIQQLILPRGWTLPVTPGTQLVTIGGAIANDVHGKNHHVAGSFGHHVRRLLLARCDGSQAWIDAEHHPELFAATIGGIGLTGVVVEAELQLERSPGPWLDTETHAFESLDVFFALSDASTQEGWLHTVAWVDCLAGRRGQETRGIFQRANPADDQSGTTPRRLGLGVPATLPVSLVNAASLRLMNAIYYHGHRMRSGHGRSHQDPFLYPLDSLAQWNRIYGPRGFHQYQCALPRASGEAAVREMLGAIAAVGQGSFLTTLKIMGDRPAVGMLSFPMPGVTLALDFPHQAERTEQLFRRLDAIVGAAGGRLYLAKDSRQPQALFQSGYPLWEEFTLHRDPGISSSMSRRLFGS